MKLTDNDLKNWAGTIAVVIINTLSQMTVENRALMFEKVREKFCTDCGLPAGECRHEPMVCMLVKNGGLYQIVDDCVHISKRELDELKSR